MNDLEQQHKKVCNDRDELLDMLHMLVARRLRASLGSTASSDGRYQKAIELLSKHGIDVKKTWRSFDAPE